ncbi:MAG: V-type ATP synthase subunit F [Nitrospiria bacterium]
MAWIAALTHPETALGFRLAGIETFAVQDDREAESFLKDLLARKDAGVVIISEDFLPFLSERTRKKVEESLQPVCVPIPDIQSWREGEKKEEYLSRLLRNLMGYQIKIKR